MITDMECSENVLVKLCRHNIPEKNMDAINVSAIQANGVSRFCRHILETQEIIWHLRWASHLTGSVQTKNQQVHHQTVVLNNERSKLESTNNAIGVGVIHVLQER